jgi:hypothetical protein
VRSAARPLLVALAILGAAALGETSSATAAATLASIQPSFAPDRLGSSAALTLGIRLSGGGEEGVPPPLRTLVVQLPAGLGVDLRGIQTCSAVRLRRAGAAGCPSASLLGHGQAALEAHGPGRGGAATFEILSQGYTPLDERTIATAVLQGSQAPYGSKLTVSIPPIPTVMYEPDASVTSLSLTLERSGVISVPRTCPRDGFAFAAALTFTDQTTAAATAAVPCP